MLRALIDNQTEDVMARGLTRRFLCAFFAALAAIALSIPAIAEDAVADVTDQSDQQEEQATTAQGEPILEEIVVTAQKREETVKEIPVSVTALPEATLGVLTAGGADVKFLSGRVPSLFALGHRVPSSGGGRAG